MKAYIFLILAFSFSALWGCGATTPNELRQRPSSEDHFTVARNYQTVFDSILQKMDECYPVPKENRINTLKGEGQIVTRMNGNYGMVIDITKTEENMTKVDVFFMFNTKPLYIPRHGAFNKAGCPQ